MKTSVFQFKDYKAFLNSLLKSDEYGWGSISKLADAAGCQRSYLSRCLNAEVHLTMDQAFLIARALSLSETEKSYFMTLVEKDRASSIEYRQELLARLRTLKEEQEDLRKVVDRPPVRLGEQEVLYYSNWLLTALHIIVSIPSLQTPKAISERLQVDIKIVESSLALLEEMKLIRREGKKWVFNSSEVHVAKTSPLVHLHHNNWRQRAVLDSQKMNPESVHFTVIQSMDQKAFEEIRGRIIKLVAEAGGIARPAPSEEIVCLAMDFFKV